MTVSIALLEWECYARACVNSINTNNMSWYAFDVHKFQSFEMDGFSDDKHVNV